MNLRFSRQTDIIDPKLLSMPITIVGAGAVGSWSAMALAKMGCDNLTVIDHDKVGEENIGAQLYGFADIGKNKVDALEEIIEKNTQSEIFTYNSKGEDILPTIETNILILALDSLAARKTCLLASQSKPPAYVIDIRMKAELISAYLVFDQESGLNFHKSIENDIKIDKGKCSEKAVVYNTFFCGGLVANLVKKIASGEKLPKSVIVDLKELKIY